MISSTIQNEAIFWLHAVLLGVQLLFLYDLLRIFRRVIIHKKATTIGLEDFLYWLVSACLIFRLLYQFNYGVIRWFAVLAILTGALLYHRTLSKPFVSCSSKGLKTVLNIIGRPFVCIFMKMQKVQKRAASRLQARAVKRREKAADRRRMKEQKHAEQQLYRRQKKPKKGKSTAESPEEKCARKQKVTKSQLF